MLSEIWVECRFFFFSLYQVSYLFTAFHVKVLVKLPSHAPTPSFFFYFKMNLLTGFTSLSLSLLYMHSWVLE